MKPPILGSWSAQTSYRHRGRTQLSVENVMQCMRSGTDVVELDLKTKAHYAISNETRFFIAASHIYARSECPDLQLVNSDNEAGHSRTPCRGGLYES